MKRRLTDNITWTGVSKDGKYTLAFNTVGYVGGVRQKMWMAVDGDIGRWNLAPSYSFNRVLSAIRNNILHYDEKKWRIQPYDESG